MRKPRFYKSLAAPLAAIAIAAALSAAVYAAPASPYPIEERQADGSLVEVTAHGDENFHWHEDEEGYVVAYDEAGGNWCYAKIENDAVVPTRRAVGKWSLQARIRRDRLEPLARDAGRRRRGGGGRPVDTETATSLSPGEEGLRTATSASVVRKQTKNRQPLLLLLIEYNNRQFSTAYLGDKTTTQFWSERYFGATGKTVNAYYNEVSGAFNLQFTKPVFAVGDGYSTVTGLPPGVASVQIKDGVARVKLSKNHPNNKEGSLMVKPDVQLAFDAVKGLVNFTGLETANGGTWLMAENFNVAAVLAGYDATAGSSSNTPSMWAHASYSFSTSDAGGAPRNIAVVDFKYAKTLASYAAHGELYSSTASMPVGASCHELGHILGLPDLYSVAISGGEGIGNYSVMASGSWGTDNTPGGDGVRGHTPTHLDAQSKLMLGFKDPVNVASGDYAKTYLNTFAGDYNILKVTNNAVDAKQYFLVENRQLAGFDKGLGSGGGILIYHVDERPYECAGIDGPQCNDNNYHKFVQVEKYSAATPSACWYTAGGLFGAATTPNSNFHTAGHVSNSFVATNCHPQNLATGIQIRVNSSPGASMEVELGSQEVTFTAQQVGGAPGTVDSTGIQLTFSRAVPGLSASSINVINGEGAVVKGTMVAGSGTTWTLALSSVIAQGEVTVSLGDLGSTRVLTGPQAVMIYQNQYTGPLTSVTVTAAQTGGASNTADSTGITLSFSEAVTGLTAAHIYITNGTGAAVKGALTGEGDTWNLALSRVTAQGGVTLGIYNFGVYTVTNSPAAVQVYRNANPPVNVTFGAAQTGGARNTADSTGVRLTFSQAVSGLTAEDITLDGGTGAAAKGALTGAGTTWNLALSGVTAQGTVTVRVANFGNYIVTGAPSIEVFKRADALTFTGATNIDYLGGTTLTFSKPVTSFKSTGAVTVSQVDGNSLAVQSTTRFLFKSSTATVTAQTEAGPLKVPINIKPTFFQYLIIVLLFGWIWY